MQKFLKCAAISVATLLMISGICFVLLSVQDLHAASELIDSLYEKRVVGLSVQGNLQFATRESRRRVLYLLTTRDYEAKLRHIAYTREADLRVDLLTGRSLMLGLGGEAIHTLHEFGDRWLKYCDIRDDVIALSLQGRNSEALQREATASLLFESPELSIRQVKADIGTKAARETANNKKLFRRTAFELLALLGVVCVRLVWLFI